MVNHCVEIVFLITKQFIFYGRISYSMFYKENCKKKFSKTIFYQSIFQND